MAELVFREEVYAIIGAAVEARSQMGCGFLEACYQEAFELELGDQLIPFATQVPIRIRYKGRELKKEYIADFLCYDKIVVEIKATEVLTTREEAQLLNYLKATGFKVGLLINFGSVGQLEWKRKVR